MAVLTRGKRRRAAADSYNTPRQLVAAALPIALDKPRPRPLKAEEWQRDSLAYYNNVGEYKQLLLWRGNQVSKLRFYPATVAPGDLDGNPIPLDAEEAGIPEDFVDLAFDTLAKFKSQIGGQRETIRRAEILLEATGEVWIVGLAPGDGPGRSVDEEDWFAASVSEVTYKKGSQNTPGKWLVKRRRDAKTEETIELDKTTDQIFRVWLPSAEYAEEADCSARGLISEFEYLYLLSCRGKNDEKIRMSAGFLLWPNELSVGPQPPGVVPQASEPEQGGEAVVDPTLRDVGRMLTNSVQDPEDPASVVRLLVRGPAELLKDLPRTVDLGRPNDGEIDTKIEARVKRIARSLNAPPEVVEGHMQTTFANAKQVTKDVWEDYLQPRALFFVDILTIGYYRVQMLKKGADPALVARTFVWYDQSDLVEHPDLGQEADAAFDRFAISWATYRDAKGFGDDDAPDPIEMLVRYALGAKGGPTTPNVVGAILDQMDSGVTLPDPTLPAPADGGAPAGQSSMSMTEMVRLFVMAEAQIRHRTESLRSKRIREARAARGGPVDVRGPSPALAAVAREASRSKRRPNEAGLANGRKLIGIDREFRARLLAASSASMDRAMERAGNRLRARTDASVRAALLKDVPRHLTAAALGQQLVAAAGGEDYALDGAFDDLEDEFLSWAETAGQQAIDVVNDVVGGFSQERRDQLGLRLADSAGEAWSWMKDTLTSLARARLFDPSPSAPPLGEFDPSLKVPPGLVRQATARAGGSAGLWTNGKSSGPDAWVALTDTGNAPAGGIASGQIMQDAWGQDGATVDGYVWDYGQALRKNPLESHQLLDGQSFESFDDDVLANGDDFPDTDFLMPGDHDGCMCDAVPVLLDATYDGSGGSGDGGSADDGGE